MKRHQLTNLKSKCIKNTYEVDELDNICYFVDQDSTELSVYKQEEDIYSSYLTHEEKEIFTNCNIAQLDGNCDEIMISDSDTEIECNAYAINCENKKINILLNFLRKFFGSWPLTYIHPLCNFQHKDENCFYCLIRSSCLRIEGYRVKGPRSMKPYEYVSQLFKYEENGYN